MYKRGKYQIHMVLDGGHSDASEVEPIECLLPPDIPGYVPIVENLPTTACL